MTAAGCVAGQARKDLSQKNLGCDVAPLQSYPIFSYKRGPSENTLAPCYTPAMPHLDEDAIRHALQVARAEGFRQVRLRAGSATFTAQLQEPGLHEENFPEPDQQSPGGHAETAELTSVPVTANAVGYLRAKPLAPGDKIQAGDIVAEIIALGIANDVPAKTSGTIDEILVQDGDAVEYGQTILTLKPNP